MIDLDQQIFWDGGFLKLNSTILITWCLMLALVIFSWLITRKLSTDIEISKWQNTLEIIVVALKDQIREVGIPKPETYLPFLGTLFLFIAFASLCTIIPGYIPPTSSLSTTTALAICVFLAVPIFGISEGGWKAYFKTYFQPTFIVLPFNVIGEISRTVALAIRLFGNMMSGVVILSILISVAPFIFPIVMNVIGLLTGLVQAYIFSILAAVFIAAAIQESRRTRKLKTEKK